MKQKYMGLSGVCTREGGAPAIAKRYNRVFSAFFKLETPIPQLFGVVENTFPNIFMHFLSHVGKTQSNFPYFSVFLRKMYGALGKRIFSTWNGWGVGTSSLKNAEKTRLYLFKSRGGSWKGTFFCQIGIFKNLCFFCIGIIDFIKRK